MPLPLVNYHAVPHTSVFEYRVNQRSHVTKITEVKGNATQFIGGKFPSRLLCSVVIGFCASGIKAPFQTEITTSNVMVALSGLFDVSMEIYHGKFTLRNVGHTH